MANVEHHLPDLVIVKNLFRCGHARGEDTVPNNPAKLPVGITLHGRRVQLRYGWRHIVRKGDAGILAIQPVTDHAIGPEVKLPGVNILFDSGEWVHIRPTADSESVLRSLHDEGFEFSRGAHAAARHHKQGHRRESGDKSLPDA